MAEVKNNIAVIGDIHGCISSLESLYSKIPSGTDVYSVGDLVDRGKYSREVIEFVIQKGIRVVRGNHEDMLMTAIDSTVGLFNFANKDIDHYYTNGGRETQFSYSGSRAAKDFKKFAEEFKKCGHYEFVNSFPLKYEFPKAVITHAGIIKEDDEVSMMWNRKEPLFINKLQIHGHTPISDFSYKPNHYINIDTGCVYNNKLTAVIVDTGTGKALEVYQVNCNPADID